MLRTRCGLSPRLAPPLLPRSAEVLLRRQRGRGVAHPRGAAERRVRIPPAAAAAARAGAARVVHDAHAGGEGAVLAGAAALRGGDLGEVGVGARPVVAAVSALHPEKEIIILREREIPSERQFRVWAFATFIW